MVTERVAAGGVPGEAVERMTAAERPRRAAEMLGEAQTVEARIVELVAGHPVEQAEALRDLVTVVDDVAEVGAIVDADHRDRFHGHLGLRQHHDGLAVGELERHLHHFDAVERRRPDAEDLGDGADGAAAALGQDVGGERGDFDGKALLGALAAVLVQGSILPFQTF